MLNWIQELEALQPELEKDKVLLLSDHRIRSLQYLCKRPLYQVAMVALFCTMRKSGKSVRVGEFIEAARAALPGKPVVLGLESLITANWFRLHIDSNFFSDEALRFTRPVEQALQLSDFSLLPPSRHTDPHWHLRKLYARACAFRRGHRSLRDWSLFCDEYERSMRTEQRRILRQAGWNKSDRDMAFYAATIALMESSDFDIRSLLFLFAPDPIERAVLRSRITHPDHALLCDAWWTLEDTYRGDKLLQLSSRMKKLFIPDIVVDSTKKIHPALNSVSCGSIHPVELVYESSLQESLDTLQRLCSASTFESYADSFSANAMRGLVVQLHGAPGTGKTEFCYQLARTTGRDILVFDVSQARDKYYGETEKLITGIFREYNKLIVTGEPFPILLFNEGDSIFQRRVNNDRDSSQTENTIQTILLNELERFQAILLVTTNTPQHFDKAFERRFQFRLGFDAPGEQARFHLLRSALPECNSGMLAQIASECLFTAAELQNALRRVRIEEICERSDKDRSARVWELLRTEKKLKSPIGFKI